MAGRVLALALVGLLGVVGWADWDPPRPPPIKVLVEVGPILFREIPSDGLFDNTLELLFVAVFNSNAGRGHISATATVTPGAEQSMRLNINFRGQLGFECTPCSAVSYAYALIELDNGGRDILKGVIDALNEAASWQFRPYELQETLEDLEKMKNSLAEVAQVVNSSWLPVTNGHDFLAGDAGFAFPERQEYFENHEGEGNVSVRISVLSEEVEDTGQCGVSEPEEEPTELEEEPTREPERGEPPSEEDVSQAYEPLHDVYWKIAEMRGESGARRFTRAEMDRIKRSYMSLLLRSAAAFALQCIMQACWEGEDLSALQEAWNQFLRGERYAQTAIAARGQEARDVNMDRALTAYERAAKAAARAMAGSTYRGPGSFATAPSLRTPDAFHWASVGASLPGVTTNWASLQAGGGFELPLYLLLLPDFLAVKAETEPGVVAMVAGASEDLEVTVSGAPAGMGVQVEQLREIPGLFLVRLPTQGLPPGEYQLTVTATAGGESVSQELTLWVEEAP